MKVSDQLIDAWAERFAELGIARALLYGALCTKPDGDIEKLYENLKKLGKSRTEKFTKSWELVLQSGDEDWLKVQLMAFGEGDNRFGSIYAHEIMDYALKHDDPEALLRVIAAWTRHNLVSDTINWPTCSTILHAAAEQGKTRCVFTILEAYPDQLFRTDAEKRTVLHYAVMGKNIDCVTAILNAYPGLGMEVDTNGQNIAHYAARQGDTKCLREIIKARPGIEKALARDARNFNFGKGNIAYFATINGKTDCIRAVLQDFPELARTKPEYRYATDHTGCYIEHFAAISGNEDCLFAVMEYLILNDLEIKRVGALEQYALDYGIDFKRVLQRLEIPKNKKRESVLRAEADQWLVKNHFDDASLVQIFENTYLDDRVMTSSLNSFNKINSALQQVNKYKTVLPLNETRLMIATELNTILYYMTVKISFKSEVQMQAIISDCFKKIVNLDADGVMQAFFTKLFERMMVSVSGQSKLEVNRKLWNALKDHYIDAVTKRATKISIADQEFIAKLNAMTHPSELAQSSNSSAIAIEKKKPAAAVVPPAAAVQDTPPMQLPSAYRIGLFSSESSNSTAENIIRPPVEEFPASISPKELEQFADIHPPAEPPQRSDVNVDDDDPVQVRSAVLIK